MRIFLLLLLCFPFVSCKKEELTPKKPTVLVSVPPYAYFVNKIAGDSVDVETLVPSGANPHIYEATPRQVERHQNAALWIYLGEPLDKKVLQFFRETHKRIAIVDVAHGITLLSHCDEKNPAEHTHHCHDQCGAEGEDLHIWLSPTLAKIQARRIAEGLITLLPNERQRFEANLNIFLDDLDHLNTQISKILLPMREKAILVSHPAFAYFCKDYHLTQLSIEMEGKDPLPQHVTEILQAAKKHQIQSVLAEPQYSNKGAELIAHSLGLPTHLVDPYAENYPENLLHIAEVIAQ